MLHEFFEQASFQDDPLEKMLRDEAAEDEIDAYEAQCKSGMHRTYPKKSSDADFMSMR